MDPRPFAAPRAAPFADAPALLLRGAGWLAAGTLAIVSARYVWLRTGSRVAATLLLLPGLSLVLHFGLCNLLTGSWRAFGIGVRPLFRAPLLAHSLGEFWGRRWNLAFSEMAAAVVYRPLAARHGRAAGVAAAFALSGVLHELAISVPVRAGIGLPFLYFALHGGLVLLEDALARRGLRLSGAAARIWTLWWLALPLLALFHPYFLRAVVWPLAGVGE
jgi:alginate O-acetyltransferase complex protein AlgI